MKYTVIDDSASLTSIVEGLSKLYDVDIVTTENTLNLLHDKTRMLKFHFEK